MKSKTVLCYLRHGVATVTWQWLLLERPAFSFFFPKASAACLTSLYPLTHKLKNEHPFLIKGKIITNHHIAIYKNICTGSLRTQTSRMENPEEKKKKLFIILLLLLGLSWIFLIIRFVMSGLFLCYTTYPWQVIIILVACRRLFRYFFQKKSIKKKREDTPKYI